MNAKEAGPVSNGVVGDASRVQIDGTGPLSRAAVEVVVAACAKAEALGGLSVVPIFVSGAPGPAWTRDVDVALVSKWERALRRLERLNATTVAVASGDVGGLALDALLATDFRIVTPDTRLVVSVDGDATWPGMATYRLTAQAGIAPIRRAVLFGHPIEAADAVALSLVDEVTEEPEKALAAVTESVATLSGKELAIRRQLMHDASTTSFEEALGAHLAACDRTLRRRSPAEAAS